MFRVIIAGTRDFNDYPLLCKKLDKLLVNKTDVMIVSGGARGADKLGEDYAREKDLKLQVFPADWNTYGKSAGYIRNKQMSQNAEACVCFWDGKSRGTQHMINLATEQGLELRIVKY